MKHARIWQWRWHHHQTSLALALGKALADFWASQLAREKNASRCGAKHIDVKIGDQFLDTHGWLKKDQVKKNARFTTVATTFLEPKKPCWSIVGVTIGAVSNPPGCLWFNWFVKFIPHYYPRLFHIDMSNDLFSLTIYDDVPYRLNKWWFSIASPWKKGNKCPVLPNVTFQIFPARRRWALQIKMARFGRQAR